MSNQDHSPIQISKPVPAELDSYSIEEFCRRNSISRGSFYNMRDAGTGPREKRDGSCPDHQGSRARVAVTPMTRLHPNDEYDHVHCVAIALLASGRATAAEVADLSGLSLERVQQFVDTLTASTELAWTSHGARGWWLANRWNALMARLADDHLDEALRRLDLDDGSIESMVYIPSRYLAHS